MAERSKVLFQRDRSPQALTNAETKDRALRLPAIPFRRLRFELTSRSHARLSEFKGSMLRGAFGHSLRRTACTMGPQQPCETCSLRTACAHSRLFETFIEGEPPPFFKGLTKAPRPYVLEVAEERREFAPGETLGFDLLLLGEAIALEPYARLAVERMAPAGLGSGKAPFDVTSLTVENGSTPAGGELADSAAERLRLRFLTPTRLKVRGELVASPTPRQLVFQMLRRVLEIAAFHVPGAAVDWNFRALLNHADTIEVESSDLHWHDWRRYSNRQKTEMLLGGFVGEMTLVGDLAPVLPLFRAVVVLHVGKGTTFGLGWVGVGKA
jgi:hypothetical protein